jgi:hypothetical protein
MRDDELEVGGEGGSPTLLPHPLPTDKNSGLISESIFFFGVLFDSENAPGFQDASLSFQSDFHVLLKIRQLQELCFRFFFSQKAWLLPTWHRVSLWVRLLARDGQHDADPP